MPQDELSDELDAFFAAYSDAFAARDLAAIDALFEYPFVVLNADGAREVEDLEFYRDLLDQFQGSEWATTRVEKVQKMRMGKDGAILRIEYTRLRADGSKLTGSNLPFENGSAYLLRRRDDGWKIVGLVDRHG